MISSLSGNKITWKPALCYIGEAVSACLYCEQNAVKFDGSHLPKYHLSDLQSLNLHKQMRSVLLTKKESVGVQAFG